MTLEDLKTGQVVRFNPVEVFGDVAYIIGHRHPLIGRYRMIPVRWIEGQWRNTSTVQPFYAEPDRTCYPMS